MGALNVEGGGEGCVVGNVPKDLITYRPQDYGTFFPQDVDPEILWYPRRSWILYLCFP